MASVRVASLRRSRLAVSLTAGLVAATALGALVPAPAATAATYALTFNGPINAIVVDSSGNQYIGGDFYPSPAPYVDKADNRFYEISDFKANVAATSTLNGLGSTLAIAIDPADESIVVGGYFSRRIKKYTRYGVEYSPFKENINSDHTLENGGDRVSAVGILSDRTIIAAGNFVGSLEKYSKDGVRDTTYAANVAVCDSRFQRIDPGGEDFLADPSDPTSNQDPNGDDYSVCISGQTPGAMIVLPDDSVVLAIGVDGYPLRKFDSTGHEDVNFALNAHANFPNGDWIAGLAYNPSDGTILVGGYLSGKNIKKFDTSGNEVMSFNNSWDTSEVVRSIAVDPSDNSMVVGGELNTDDPVTHNRNGYLVRIKPDGTLDSNFASQPLHGFDGPVNIVAIAGDHSFLAGGGFTGNYSRVLKTGADWTGPTSFAVAYDSNGSTSGSLPASTWGSGSVALATNSGTLAKTGSVFGGWNTLANGTGTTYATGASYSLSADVTLYAKWGSPASYSITYDGNSSTGGAVPSNTTGSGSVTLASNSGSLVRSGYTFAGWNTLADGTGTSYATGASYSLNASTTLYAKWTAASQTITYGANGGTGSVSSTTGSTGASVAIASGSALSQTGFTFDGWATSSGGSVVYTAGQSITMPAGGLALYAHWTAAGGGGGGSGGGGGGSSGGSSGSSSGSSGGSSGSSSGSSGSATVTAPTVVLAPIPPGTNPSLPPSGVSSGSSVLLVDGAAQQVTVKPDAPIASNATALVATGEGFTMKVAGLDPVGTPLGVTNDAALVLQPDNTASVEGSGFAPNTDVQVYMFSTARLLGTVHTDGTGSFKGMVPVPKDLELGHHTLQVNALTPSGSVRSLSLGVELRAPVKVPGQRVVTAKIVFANGSYGLPKGAVSTLRALLTQVGTKAFAGLVVAYAPARDTATANRALSKHRAKEVAAFLHTYGIKGTIATRVDGTVAKGKAARTAFVTLQTRP